MNGRRKVAAKVHNYQNLLRDVDGWVLRKVLAIFHLDFTMFGYDRQPFIDIIEQKKTKVPTGMNTSGNTNSTVASGEKT